MNRRLSLSLVLAAMASASATVAAELSPAAYEEAKAATVEILVNGHLNGSGWIGDAKGLIVTAGHVVESPDRRFEVVSPALGRKEAKLLAVDLGHDLALLSIALRKEGYPALKPAQELAVAGRDRLCHWRPALPARRPDGRHRGQRRERPSSTTPTDSTKSSTSLPPSRAACRAGPG